MFHNSIYINFNNRYLLLKNYFDIHICIYLIDYSFARNIALKFRDSLTQYINFNNRYFLKMKSDYSFCARVHKHIDIDMIKKDIYTYKYIKLKSNCTPTIHTLDEYTLLYDHI